MTEHPRPIRLHLQNQPSEAPAFHATEAVWAAAAERHPDLARRLAVTIGWTQADFEAAIPSAEILVTWVSVVKETRAVYAHGAPHLRMIFCTSAGIDRVIPFDWLPDRVVLLNNSGVHAQKSAEWGLMAILMLANRMPLFATRQRARRFEKIYAPSVAGQTLLVVGVGALASPIIDQARSFGMNVIGVRHAPVPHPGCHRVITTAALDDALPEADILLLACPLTPETTGMISRARLARMKPTAGIVNMARGAIVDQEALCDALEAGRLGGAVLDVVTPEPLPPDSRIWDTPNLLLSPHVSVDDPHTYTPRSLDLFFTNFGHWLKGEPMPNRIDTRRGY